MKSRSCCKYQLFAPLLLQGKTVVAVTSGANMNFDRLRLVSGAFSLLLAM